MMSAAVASAEGGVDALAVRGPAAAAPVVTPGELAELMAAFNAVTSRLEGTHESLRREVARLQAELHAATEQLQRSKRLAALGEMAAGIAHEVRNPLGSMSLYARLLEDDLSDRPREREVAGKIAACVRRLDAVVGDVLSFSREMRVAAGRASGLVLLARALEEARLPGVEAVAVDGPVEVGGAEMGGVDHRVDARVDAGLVHQALVNLIRNALEAMADMGPRAGGHRLALRARRVDGWAVLSVADTGPGIRPEVIDRMFNPFFTTRATGTGLGLAIVHRIVDAHGGRVEVRNNAPGPGATLELWLPAAGTADGLDRRVDAVGGAGSEVGLVAGSVGGLVLGRGAKCAAEAQVVTKSMDREAGPGVGVSVGPDVGLVRRPMVVGHQG